jgi:hypothetical protein
MARFFWAVISGIATAARIATMIATTINSTSVNPALLFLIMEPSSLLCIAVTFPNTRSNHHHLQASSASVTAYAMPP